jgi:hypothetical protein
LLADPNLNKFVGAIAAAFADWCDIIVGGRARLAGDPAHQ